jgi:hypothetical protein
MKIVLMCLKKQFFMSLRQKTLIMRYIFQDDQINMPKRTDPKTLIVITSLSSRCLKIGKIPRLNERFLPFILLFLTLGSCLTASAQRKPTIGISLGAATLSGSSGFMFDSNLEAPHRDFGVQAGLTAIVPMDMDLHLTIGAMASYERSHYHTDVGVERNPVTGYFHYGFMQIPILLNHAPMHKSKSFFVLKEFFGFGLNFGNAFDAPNQQDFGSNGFTSRTVVNQNWQINPEFIIGMGLISRQLKVGKLHYSMSLHIDIARNQNFQAWLVDTHTNNQVFVERTIRGVKGQVSMTYYPSFKRKKKECYRFGR